MISDLGKTWSDMLACQIAVRMSCHNVFLPCCLCSVKATITDFGQTFDTHAQSVYDSSVLDGCRTGSEAQTSLVSVVDNEMS